MERTGDLPSAAELYTGILASFPRATIARGRLAEVLVKQGDNERAMAVLRDGITVEPESPVLHRGLGMLLERAGQFPEAIKSYREYARLAPNKPGREAVRRACPGAREEAADRIVVLRRFVVRRAIPAISALAFVFLFVNVPPLPAHRRPRVRPTRRARTRTRTSRRRRRPPRSTRTTTWRRLRRDRARSRTPRRRASSRTRRPRRSRTPTRRPSRPRRRRASG